ncbi:UNVERIFIED_CONTAM: hypothetical protein GTU68_031041 [Idotea baltica]|nr:hypothetical protein [Idotea baltica]
MPVRLRLARHGRKGQPFYYIVAADSRAPRDGKYLQKIGTYNPMPDPAVIKVDHDAAIKWLKNGAQPSDTVRSILRYTGVNLKFALIKQGKDPEQDAAKLAAEALAKEAKLKEEKAAAIAAKNAPPVVEVEAPAEEEVAEASAEAEATPEAEAPAEEKAAE